MTPREGTRWIVRTFFWPIWWDALCRRLLCPFGLHRWNDNGQRATCALCPKGDQ